MSLIRSGSVVQLPIYVFYTTITTVEEAPISEKKMKCLPQFLIIKRWAGSSSAGKLVREFDFY